MDGRALSQGHEEGAPATIADLTQSAHAAAVAGRQVGGLLRSSTPIAPGPEGDWPRRLTTYYAHFAQNVRIAPNITVVVPVYNTPAEYLAECVSSLLRQTVKPREILIVDDGTTLAEAGACLNVLRDLPGLRLVRNDHNISLGPTMNRALHLCQTDFALKLDSDDLARPQLIEKIVAFTEMIVRLMFSGASVRISVCRVSLPIIQRW
jgi:cellulose synthase/poly-beta-1,6-N-acetylglucosamine synthase-like glycosyltransferase